LISCMAEIFPSSCPPKAGIQYILTPVFRKTRA
jgi:hypothetical protein